MSAPVRVQLRRAKGWRMPSNTVKVDRTTPYGNPFVVGSEAPHVYSRFHEGVVQSAEQAVALFRRVISHELARQTPSAERTADLVAALHGKNLACWCRLCAKHAAGRPFDEACPDCAPCHADVLLELSNAPEPDAAMARINTARDRADGGEGRWVI